MAGTGKPCPYCGGGWGNASHRHIARCARRTKKNLRRNGHRTSTPPTPTSPEPTPSDNMADKWARYQQAIAPDFDAINRDKERTQRLREQIAREQHPDRDKHTRDKHTRDHPPQGGNEPDNPDNNPDSPTYDTLSHTYRAMKQPPVDNTRRHTPPPPSGVRPATPNNDAHTRAQAELDTAFRAWLKEHEDDDEPDTDDKQEPTP